LALALYDSSNRPERERSRPELSGVKIWPARNRYVTGNGYPDHLADQRSIQVTLNALPAGTTFSTKMRFHNLRPIELGALLWALSLGNEAAWIEGTPIKLRHRLGMGKPYGLGEISVRLMPNTLVMQPNDALSTIPNIPTLVKTFVSAIAAVVPDWLNAPQLRTLYAAADPAFGQAAEQVTLPKPNGRPAAKPFDYMELRPGTGGWNDFADEKTAGRFLPDYMKEPVIPKACVGARIRLNGGDKAEGVITGGPFATGKKIEWLVLLDGRSKPIRYDQRLFTVIASAEGVS
jgi:hypothetical protein